MKPTSDLATRAERVALARLFRAGGMGVAEIAQRLGVARSTVRGYLHFPDAAARHAAREGARCACGAEVSRPDGRCVSCAGRARTRWTEYRARETLVSFWRLRGRFPTTRELTESGHPRALPSRATIVRLFGSLDAARREVRKTLGAIERPSRL